MLKYIYEFGYTHVPNSIIFQSYEKLKLKYKQLKMN